MNFRSILHVAVSLPLLFMGCSSGEQGPSGQGMSTVMPSLEAVQAQYGSLPLEERLSGIVRAGNQVEIYSRVTAPVEEVLAENGEIVTEGQPLVRLESREFNERVSQAQANLRVNEARARQAEARLNELNNQLRRQESLSQQNLISSADLEAIQAQVASAEADLELVLAQVDQAESALSEQQDMLNRTVIRAPISGTVGGRSVEVGMQVNPNSQLFMIGDLERTKVIVNLTENMLRYVDIGHSSRIYSETMGDTLLYGEVSRISPFLARGSFSTEAEIDISNASGLLLPGMFVTVDILYGESEQTTIIPLSAIYKHPRTGQEGIYVVPGFGLETDPITDVDSDNPPPLSDPTEVEFRTIEVVAKGREAAGVTGVQSGDWVVTVGQSLMVGSTDNRARIRAASWERIMSMQQIQPEDLLHEVMSRDFSAGFRSGN